MGHGERERERERRIGLWSERTRATRAWKEERSSGGTRGRKQEGRNAEKGWANGAKEKEGTLSERERAFPRPPRMRRVSWPLVDPSAPSASNRFSCTSTPLSFQWIEAIPLSRSLLPRPRTSFSHVARSLLLSRSRSAALFFPLSFSVSRSLQTSA